MRKYLLFRMFTVACIAWSPQSVYADLEQVVSDQILPGTAEFSAQASALETAAETQCSAETLRPTYHRVFDAWLTVSHIRFGPLERLDAGQSIAYWPDTKGFTGRALGNLIRDEDPVINSAADFVEVSVAGRGLFALEKMLFDPSLSGYDVDSYSCRLVQALATDLALTARELDRQWREEFADIVRTAGSDDNQVYLSEEEAIQTVYTAILSGLEFNESLRLGRPLGTFERPRPRRAEANLSARSLLNVILSLQALKALTDSLVDQEIPRTDAAFDRTIEYAIALDDPVFTGVAVPQSRLKIEILQIEIKTLMNEIELEVGPILGVIAGFNSQDGD